jgi:Photosynthesis system II assembly factor YCF48
MALDDRERNFEDALARHFQANRSAKASAGTPASAPHDDCPDAEILAAYHERLLDAEEMILRKEHIASCPRCQEVLAQLEGTEEIGLKSDREEFALRSAAALPPTPHVHAAGASASPLASPSVAKPSAAIEMPRRRGHRRWLVPAGALAAGLLVWIAIHDRIATRTPFNLAKNQSQPAPEFSPRTASPPTDATEEKSAELGRQAPPPKPDAAGRDENAAGEKARKRKPVSPSSVPAKTGDLPSGDSVASDQRRANALRISPQPAPDNKQVARSATPESPSSAPTVVSESVAVSAEVQPVPQEAKKEAAPNGVAAAPSLEPSPAVNGRAYREIVNLQALQAGRNLVSVSSPNGAVVWRLLSSGIIQRSVDAGANWTVQKTATVADLLAGSAVSEKICWIVGRGGTVLLTTDGGNHWLRVSSPTTDDTTTVFAVDAQQATITTAKNKSYKTTDGGTTWTPLANP